MRIDTDRITHPLCLARGSHRPGSGKGCAMNVISYVNGDTNITDYPKCSARLLARMVQLVNDNLAAEDGFLSPENSLLVLDLAWKTVGTADVSNQVVLQWATCVFGVAPKGWKTANYAAHRWALLTSEELSTEQLVGFVDHAIDVWRDLAGLHTPANLTPAELNSALQRIG